MSAKCHLCLLGLIFLSSLLTGSSGVNETHVFISSGGNVRLPCNNALPDCKSTTWNYERLRDSAAVELIAGGIKKKDTKSRKRLSLGSDCSLNIKNITEEDYGSYFCRQYVNNNQEGTDARVFLHVLHVSSSSSSSQTEISAGRSVTLSCQLYSYAGVSCDDWIRSEGIELFWVNQAGVKLKISRYQISAPDHCIITLTTTLLNEDDNREWRCSVTHRDQVKSSATHTAKISDEASERSSSAASDSRTLIAVSSSNSQMKSRQTPAAAPERDMITNPAETEVRRTAGSLFRVIVIIVEFAAFAAPTLILLQIICARRAENKEKPLPTMKKLYDGVLVPC